MERTRETNIKVKKARLAKALGVVAGASIAITSPGARDFMLHAPSRLARHAVEDVRGAYNPFHEGNTKNNPSH